MATNLWKIPDNISLVVSDNTVMVNGPPADPVPLQANRAYVLPGRVSGLDRRFAGSSVSFVPNRPISGLRVTGVGSDRCQILDQGGRAYSLKNDALFEAILNDSIAGGILGGQYVWGHLPYKGLNLLRLGSNDYMSALNALSVSKQPNIRASSMVPGDIFANTRGRQYMFLGRFGYMEMSGGPTEFIKGADKSSPLFLKIGERAGYQQSVDRLLLWLSGSPSHYWDFASRLSHSASNLKTKISHIHIAPNIGSMIKRHAAISAAAAVARETGGLPASASKRSRIISICSRYSRYINLCAYPQKPEEDSFFSVALATV